jgi:hypothetical protein
MKAARALATMRLRRSEASSLSACVVSTKPKSFVSDAVDTILPLQFAGAKTSQTASGKPSRFRGRVPDGSWQPPKIEKRV